MPETTDSGVQALKQKFSGNKIIQLSEAKAKEITQATGKSDYAVKIEAHRNRQTIYAFYARQNGTRIRFSESFNGKPDAMVFAPYELLLNPGSADKQKLPLQIASGDIKIVPMGELSKIFKILEAIR